MAAAATHGSAIPLAGAMAATTAPPSAKIKFTNATTMTPVASATVAVMVVAALAMG
jgi:hypothetical protein